MKIVVVGIGKVGHALAEHLAEEGHDITVIDQRPDIVSHTCDVLDVIGAVGNGASYHVQKEAGVQNADLLIAASDSDEVNLLCCLVAKKLGVSNTIARVRNPEYENQLGLMMNELGISLAINPERETAREISRVLRFPIATKVETFAKGRVELVEYRIPPKSPLAGLRLSDIGHTIRARVLVCAVQRGEEVLIPDGNFILLEGDRINITAPIAQMEDFFRQLGAYRDRAHNVMIIGAGKISYYLTDLLRKMSIKVKVLDRDKTRCEAFSHSFPDVLVIEGDATDHELLSEEGLDNCDAFVALTGLDELNIMLSMYAGVHAVGRSIAKVNRNSFAEIVSKTGIVESIISASGVTVNRIVQYVRALVNSSGSNVQALHRMVDNRVEALEFIVGAGSRVIGVPLKELSTKSELLIACIHRAGSAAILPSGQDVLREGDSVVIVTTRTGLNDINDILK